jgi:hypothetical protein
MSKRLPKGAVKIYERCMEVHAIQDNDSRSNSTVHRLSQGSHVQIWGLKNGDVLLHSVSGSKLVIPKGVTLFCTEIRAEKGTNSLWPGEHFKHPFSIRSKPEIKSLPNGDILIRSQVGKRLHKKFRY